MCPSLEAKESLDDPLRCPNPREPGFYHVGPELPKPAEYLPVPTRGAQNFQHLFQNECGLREALQRQMKLSLAGVSWRGLQRHICLAQVQGPDCDIKANQLGQPAQRALNKPSSNLEQKSLAPFL